MTDPLVTVLITTYNPKYLEDTIKSVESQDYSPIELLLVDDGSKNFPAESVSNIFNHNQRYIFMDHKGLPHGLIKGVKESKGKYIAILDHDDVLTPNSISKRVEVLEKNPNAALVYGNVNYIDSSGKKYSHNRCKSYENGNQFIKDLLLKPLIPAQHTATMFRKSSIETVGNYPDIKTYFDCELFLRLAKKYPFVHLDDTVVNYRTHKSNASDSLIYRLNSLKKQFDAVDTYLKSDFNNIDHKIKVAFWFTLKMAYDVVSVYRPEFLLRVLKY